MGDGFGRGWVPKSGELGGVEGQQWAKTAKAAGSAIPQYESTVRGLGSGIGRTNSNMGGVGRGPPTFAPGPKVKTPVFCPSGAFCVKMSFPARVGHPPNWPFRAVGKFEIFQFLLKFFNFFNLQNFIVQNSDSSACVRINARGVRIIRILVPLYSVSPRIQRIRVDS